MFRIKYILSNRYSYKMEILKYEVEEDEIENTIERNRIIESYDKFVNNNILGRLKEEVKNMIVN